MSYDNMPAGPEMDRLIAEKVMGWKPQSEGAGHALFKWSDTHFHCDGPYSFNPSENIAHAWEVMERMKTVCEGSITIEIEATDHWTVIFNPERSTHASMPLALCRSAMKFVSR